MKTWKWKAIFVSGIIITTLDFLALIFGQNGNITLTTIGLAVILWGPVAILIGAMLKWIARGENR